MTTATASSLSSSSSSSSGSSSSSPVDNDKKSDKTIVNETRGEGAKVEVGEAWVVVRNCVSAQQRERWLNAFGRLIDPTRKQITMFERTTTERRHTAFLSSVHPTDTYKYAGIVMKNAGWPAEAQELADFVKSVCARHWSLIVRPRPPASAPTAIPSEDSKTGMTAAVADSIPICVDRIFCNEYNPPDDLLDKPDFIGRHSDKDSNDTEVLSVSFGATAVMRVYRIEKKIDNDGKKPHERLVSKVTLRDGDVCVMVAGMQRFYKHEIEPVDGHRYNFTARQWLRQAAISKQRKPAGDPKLPLPSAPSSSSSSSSASSQQQQQQQRPKTQLSLQFGRVSRPIQHARLK